MNKPDFRFRGHSYGFYYIVCILLISSGLFAQGDIACAASINIGLNANCEALITPSMILTGDISGIDTLTLSIVVEDDLPDNGGIVDGCGTFTVRVEYDDPSSLPDPEFEPCWGTVTARDLTPPAVTEPLSPVDLLCVDLSDYSMDLLEEGVSRCFRVTGATGEIVAGTIAPELEAILRLPTSPSIVSIPRFYDACAAQLEVCVTERVALDPDQPDCNDVVVTRTFTASEMPACDETAEANPPTSYTSVLTFQRPGLDDLSTENITAVARFDRCSATDVSSQEIRENYPAPRAEDFPFLRVGAREFPLVEGTPVCNLGVTYSDGNPTITCLYGYKFVRTYTVIDWCEPDSISRFAQIVEVGDQEAPAFSGPTQDRDFDGVIDPDLVYMTNAGDQCGAYVILDPFEVAVSDNCGGTVSITATIYINGETDAFGMGPYEISLDNGVPELSGVVPIGNHILRYRYIDVCGNTGQSDFPLTIQDGVPPTAVCEDALNVSLNSVPAGPGLPEVGQATLTPAQINAGSTDDCTVISFAIARLDDAFLPTGPYTDSLLFSCDDIGNVTVSLRVTDDAGNTNTCWLVVNVEDKEIPECQPPADRSISCIDYSTTFPAGIEEVSLAELEERFGGALGSDNCSVEVTSTASSNINNCGVGSIARTFTSTDGQGYVNAGTCIQLIEVFAVYDYRITFPKDTIGFCRREPEFAPIFAESFACDLITSNVYVDTLFAVSAPEACFSYKVLYEVINFCEYNTLGSAYRIPRDGDGIRDPEDSDLYLNVIANDTGRVVDDVAFLTIADDRIYDEGADVLLDDGDDSDGSDDDNSGDNEWTPGGASLGLAYAEDNSRGYFSYVQFIDVFDNTPPNIGVNPPLECFVGTDPDCTVDVPLMFTAFDFCQRPTVTIQLDEYYVITDGFEPDRDVDGALIGERGQYIVVIEDLPTGMHAIQIVASDGCGNVASQIVEFCVEGVQFPAPICIQRLTVTLFPDGAGDAIGTIWANDFIASDIDDCYGNTITSYSLYREEEAHVPNFVPDPSVTGADFNCADLNAPVPMRVYAIADDGSFGYCTVLAEVQSFSGGCGEVSGTIAGQVLTQYQAPVPEVMIELEGEDQLLQTTTTGADGTYQFSTLALGGDFTVQPAHAVAVDLTIVTVADVVAIGNVILGRGTFATGYDYLAADVDQDQFLSVGDMVAIQRVILGLDNIYESGDSWGFIPADLTIDDPYNNTFPEVFNINNLTGNALEADFVGFAYGDVNSTQQ